MAGGAFYAVAKGRRVGVFSTWAECERQVKGFTGAKYKKFPTLAEAQEFASGTRSEASGSSSARTPGNIMPAKRPRQDGGGGGGGTILLPAKASRMKSGATSSLASSSSSSGTSTLSRDESDGSRGERPKSLAALRMKVKEMRKDLAAFHERLEAIENQIAQEAGSDVPKEVEEIGSDSEQSGGDADGDLFSRLKKENFVLGEGEAVEVYTDGACVNNGKAAHLVRAGIGVWWNHGHPLNVSSPLPPGMRKTNNVAEIQAAVEAIRIAKANGIRRLRVNTDSQFLINCITSWIKSWKRNGWKTAKGEPVINKEELLVLDGLISEDAASFSVCWRHVRGHVGVLGNECADGLANAGAARDS